LKRIRGALETAQARIGGFIDSAMDPIVSVDERQRIIRFNPAAERVFGWPRAGVIGRPIDILLPKRFRGGHHAHVERFASQGVTSRSMGAQTVLYGLRANGEEFPVEASISLHVEDGRKTMTVIVRDISRRMHAEDALAESEARLRAVLDSAMDAIITVDEAQRIVLFNAAAEEVFCWPRDEAIGAPLAMLIPDRFRYEHAGHIERFAEAGTASRRMGTARLVLGLRRTGEEFPVEASISQALGSGQRFFTVILRDVTERVKADEALRRSNDEIQHLALAAHTAREQEKRRIARELHDELGQALTALKIDLSSMRELLGEAPAALADKLNAMQKLVESTVASARRLASDLRPMMLDDLGLMASAEWLAQSFTSRTGIPCELQMDADADLDLPDPYATAIFRVLQESLTNVAKHAQASKVEVRLERQGACVVLSVRDDGKGFTPDSARKEGSFGLTGLRERAYLLGGEVRIESSPGQGTEIHFRIDLPQDSRTASLAD
jgi:PAS domain S-box-containing protein